MPRGVQSGSTVEGVPFVPGPDPLSARIVVSPASPTALPLAPSTKQSAPYHLPKAKGPLPVKEMRPVESNHAWRVVMDALKICVRFPPGKGLDSTDFCFLCCLELAVSLRRLPRLPMRLAESAFAPERWWVPAFTKGEYLFPSLIKYVQIDKSDTR
jgi:hypothetical protein